MTDYASVLADKQAHMDEVDSNQASGADLSSISVLNVAPTTTKTKVGLYDPKKPTTAGTAEELYPGRKAIVEKLGFGTPAYKEWDAATRALMGVKKDDKFSSGQWIETLGGGSSSGQDVAEADYLSKFNVSVPSLSGMKQFYLEDTMASTKLNPVTHIKNRPVSEWAAPWQLMSEEAITKKVLEEATQATGTGEMHPLMVAALKFGQKPGEITKIGETKDTDVYGSYSPWHGEMSMNVHPGSWYPGVFTDDYDTQEHQLMDETEWVNTPFHELVGHHLLNKLEYENYGQSYRDAMEARRLVDLASQTDSFSEMEFDPNSPWGVKRTDFLSQQMPDVQALYEDDSSWMGEHITSRAATVEDLLNLNAPIHDKSNKYNTGWDELASFMQKDKTDWKTDYNPNPNLTNLEDLGYDQDLARQYDTWERFNQELPPEYLGGDPSSPLNVTYDLSGKPQKYTGLAGWPLGHHHFLVDRIIARNPDLFAKEGKKGLKRALTNELNASLANQNSTLNKLSKLGLADQFWDYVEDYLARESDDWSPSQAKKEIQKLLGE